MAAIETVVEDTTPTPLQVQHTKSANIASTRHALVHAVAATHPEKVTETAEAPQEPPLAVDPRVQALTAPPTPPLHLTQCAQKTTRLNTKNTTAQEPTLNHSTRHLNSMTQINFDRIASQAITAALIAHKALAEATTRPLHLPAIALVTMATNKALVPVHLTVITAVIVPRRILTNQWMVLEKTTKMSRAFDLTLSGMLKLTVI